MNNHEINVVRDHCLAMSELHCNDEPGPAYQRAYEAIAELQANVDIAVSAQHRMSFQLDEKDREIAALQADVERKQILLDDAKAVMERQIARRKELEKRATQLADENHTLKSWRESVLADLPTNDRIKVINNNQPGWTNIIETAPNVTLEVGTMLVRRGIAFKIAADLVEAEKKVDDLRWLVINGERYFGTLWREAGEGDIDTTRAAIAARGSTQPLADEPSASQKMRDAGFTQKARITSDWHDPDFFEPGQNGGTHDE